MPSRDQDINRVAEFGTKERQAADSERRHRERVLQTTLENADRREWAAKPKGDERKVDLKKQDWQR